MDKDIKKLIKACQQNDYKAQKELYYQFVDRLYFVVRRYVKDEDRIRSVLQDTFLRVFNKIHTYDESKAQFYTWIHTIAVRLSINEAKKTVREFRTEELLDLSKPGQPRIESDLHFQDLNKVLYEIKNSYRMVFNLYEIEGYSHREIASLLGITESSSRTYLTRAKLQLRSKINSLNR